MNISKTEIIVFAIVALAFIVGSILCMMTMPFTPSSPTPNQSIPEEFGSKQFALIGDEGVENDYFRALFFVDKKTGVEYVMLAGSLTPRYYANGSLIIHPEYIKEAEI